MAVWAKDNKREFKPAPEGLHQAVCVDVIDRGMVETEWGTKSQVEIRWQLEAEYQDEVTKATRRHLVVKRYTLSLNEKAKLRQHLEAWRNRKFTAEELKGFDLEKLLGHNCQLQIAHNLSSDGRTYSNVQAIVALGKNMAKLAPQDYVRVCDREQKPEHAPDTADDDVPF